MFVLFSEEGLKDDPVFSFVHLQTVNTRCLRQGEEEKAESKKVYSGANRSECLNK
jgi:hypothetical protein